MTIQKEIAVKVDHLTKSFKIPLESSSGLKQKLINALKGRKGYRDFTPLNDISFEIEKGDFFGIVGRNGSGKSTLLKSIAGIYTPNAGAVQVNGTLVPFIELGVGFNPELTGRENVFLNGALLGFSRSEMEAMYDEIVNFAELHDFMEERLKNYSSGMQVRLAFSIAIKARGDILLLDEVLAVGDAAFQQKCFSYFANLKQEKKTVILVTHDMEAVERFCNKAILIEKGIVKKEGSNEEVAQMYRNLFIDNDNAIHTKPQHLKATDANVIASAYQTSTDNPHIETQKPFTISMNLIVDKDIKKAALGASVVNSDGITVFAFGSGGAGEDPLSLTKGENHLEFTIEDNIYNDDHYTIDVILQEADKAGRILFEGNNIAKFKIQGNQYRKHAITRPGIKARIVNQ